MHPPERDPEETGVFDIFSSGVYTAQNAQHLQTAATQEALKCE